VIDPRLVPALRELGVPFRENEPIARHTSMGVGGPAAVMAFPRDAQEVMGVLRLRAELRVPHRILGGGSNLVVVDEGLDELVVNTEDVRRVEIGEGGELSAEGGANLIRTVVHCGRLGWSGLESAVGIPGSVGGAAVMNAGAYGFSISEVMKEIVVLDGRGVRQQPPEGWRFHYRGSSIPEGSVVTRVVLALRPGDPEAIAAQTRELTKQRVKSQPGGRNAGCVFKNPQDASAGRIIDELGLKGTRRGGAVISPRHANFVVNDQGAKAQDVIDLLDLVRDEVERRTGVALELEVKVWRPRP
jgi:UDP-N-acetylmuramate dehydrogenase